MPRSLPLVVSPLRSVLEHNGVVLMLVSVEVWQDEVVVRARGLPSELTMALKMTSVKRLRDGIGEARTGRRCPCSPSTGSSTLMSRSQMMSVPPTRPFTLRGVSVCVCFGLSGSLPLGLPLQLSR